MANPIVNMFKIPELRKRLLFTLALLAVYRLGIFITTPGVNRTIMQEIVGAGSGGFLGMFNMFSGGALERMSLFALGVMPYVSASIILQMLTIVSPQLDKLNKEGEQGRRKINQYTRYGTVLLSLLQGYFIARWLEGQHASFGKHIGDVVSTPGIGFRLLTMISLTTGTAFLMWLGEQITERGIGNGMSVIIFAGIVTDIPSGLYRLAEKAKTDMTAFSLLLIALIVIAGVAFICFVERGYRRIPVQYAKRIVGRKMYGGQTTHLPLKVNSAGVIPPIFASSVLMVPGQLATYIQTPWMQDFKSVFDRGGWQYNTLFVGLIVFFSFFYTAITYNPVDVADNLKKYGGFIPGIRPGKKTAEYIDRVMSRITFGGAIYMSVVCIMPSLMQDWFHVPFSFGGTGLMIVVGVALDLVQQIEGHLITRQYQGFTGPKGPRIRGRRAAVPAGA